MLNVIKTHFLYGTELIQYNSTLTTKTNQWTITKCTLALFPCVLYSKLDLFIWGCNFDHVVVGELMIWKFWVYTLVKPRNYGEFSFVRQTKIDGYGVAIRSDVTNPPLDRVNAFSRNTENNVMVNKSRRALLLSLWGLNTDVYMCYARMASVLPKEGTTSSTPPPASGVWAEVAMSSGLILPMATENWPNRKREQSRRGTESTIDIN